MEAYKILYKLNTNGSTQVWSIYCNDISYWTAGYASAFFNMTKEKMKTWELIEETFEVHAPPQYFNYREKCIETTGKNYDFTMLGADEA